MVAFLQTTYTVIENEGQVEVCVNLTHPQTTILNEKVHVEVYRDDIPPHFILACK